MGSFLDGISLSNSNNYDLALTSKAQLYNIINRNSYYLGGKV